MSQQQHATAMNQYEASELEACRDLRAMSSAKMYLVEGEERLMVDGKSALTGCMGLEVAPSGAMENRIVSVSSRIVS